MKRNILLVMSLLLTLMASAESITYRIVEYDNDSADFILAACGQKPADSYAWFENKYGATYGNRYNQIPRNNQATLHLEGWGGCRIERITLSMCSNNKSGTMALLVNAGEESLYTSRAEDFASEAWAGRWVSKDVGIYVDLVRELAADVPVPADASVDITIKGGTQEGSVYLNAVTIDYAAAPGTPLESPLGWIFEKIEAKGKVADGDVLMLYRSGDAAGDIDGMEVSHYLDAVAVGSTTNVNNPSLLLFTAHATTDGHWTLTSQQGNMLGAKAAQHLAWDEGVTTWDITPGYNGATIASTNSKYGTLRYNAPAGSYARFWNYTSTSLPLPYLYRRLRQQEPVTSTSLTLAATVRTVYLSEQDTLVLRSSLLPATTTDRRIRWRSSDEAVATVNGGLVVLHGAGETTLTATAADGGSEATCRLTVLEAPSAIASPISPLSAPTFYTLDGRPAASKPRGILIQHGRKYLP